MSANLIAQLSARATDSALRTDEWPSLATVAPVLTELQAFESERALGFPVPDLLKTLFQTVGNGGFGPGYGMLGLLDGAKDNAGYNAVELYTLYCSGDPDDPEWSWPKGLLPLCHWGCAIYSCVDVTAEGAPVVVFDPNAQDTSWSECFIRTDRTLEGWLMAWGEGVSLWKEVYGSRNKEDKGKPSKKSVTAHLQGT